MKLFELRYHTFGTMYFVFAETKERAIQLIKDKLVKEADEGLKEYSSPTEEDIDWERHEEREWQEATPNSLPNGYSLIIHSSEIAISIGIS